MTNLRAELTYFPFLPKAIRFSIPYMKSSKTDKTVKLLS